MAAVPRHSGLEPESRGRDVDSRRRGKDEEGALQAILIVMTWDTCYVRNSVG